MTVADLHECLPYGTTVRLQDDRVVEVVARGGHRVAALAWDDGALVGADLRLPTGTEIAIRRRGDRHPVLGVVDQLWDLAAGRRVAAFGQVDWARPEWIPPLDRPGALPAGAGAAVLNLLAISARAAEVEALRYRGPYPTAALFDALMSSFVVGESAERALHRFVADVERTSLEGTTATPEVDFVPSPFEWSWPDARICVQRRQGIERIYVDGSAFDARRRGLRRVVPTPEGGAEAIVEIAEECWARVARVGADGIPEAAPEPLPTAPAALLGEGLPQPVVDAVLQIVAARAPGPLAAALKRLAPKIRFVWGDPGLRLVGTARHGIEIHAGLVAALPTDSGPLLSTLLALVEAPLLRIAQEALAEAHAAVVQ